jgi:hypothetical protein
VVPSDTTETAPTQRDAHLRRIAERGRMGWQRVSGYNWRALGEADILKHGFQKSVGRQRTIFGPRQQLRETPNAPSFPVH